MKNSYPAFTPTEFSTITDKEHFCEQFQRFVSKGYKKTMFPKWFYTRLSMSFGHIAHYNQGGFYETFFVSDIGEQNFIEQTLAYPCYGDPAFTYSDVERYLQGWLRDYLCDGSSYELENSNG
jgi:hypothetical protein